MDDTLTGRAVTGGAKIGVVVLTYNSVADLPICLDRLTLQRGIDKRIIVVDNASTPDDRVALEAAFCVRFPAGIIVDLADSTPAMLNSAPAVFVRNPQNVGYSAGNNIGARLAIGAGCDAVFIVNPDVRISSPDYLGSLWSLMQKFPNCLVASSKVIDLGGRDEHPLRETEFWEELFWIRQLGPRMFRSAPLVITPTGSAPIVAEKLHGSCLLIRASFLTATNFLDENVFLYSEEPILATRVRAAGGRMMVFPQLEAVHAHVASTKGNPSRRMLQFIKSRRYYLDTYTSYGPFKRGALHASYGVLAMLHRIRGRLGKS